MSFGGGPGGGSGSIAGSSDVSLNNVQNNQVLGYNSNTNKWENHNVSGSTGDGSVWLDSFAGTTDDDKLAAAMSYCSAQSRPPSIRLAQRVHTLTKPIGKPYDNFCLVGSNPGFASYDTAPCLVKINAGATRFIDLTSSLEHLKIRDIFFLNTDYQTQFLGTANGSILRHAVLHNVQFGGFNGVIGNAATSQPLLECFFTGPWWVGGYKNTPLHIGGSDCMSLWPDGMDLNSNVNLASGQQEWHLICDSLGKSRIGPIYLTAQKGWRGIYIFGKSGGLAIDGAVIEGFGDSLPCDGSLIHIAGGGVSLTNCKIGCGMGNPSVTASANASGVADRALVEVYKSGPVSETTQASFFGTNFFHSAGVAHSTPVIYVSNNATVNVYGSIRFYSYGDGNAWGNDLPVIKKDSTTQTVNADATVSVT